ncbi:hypothetical protein JD844_020687 [Phrynosoma platyrhinos]|uniref:Uncharacterized protein n=1 Tax=Phrynosoma platyrhinos TaxID=52577 RepID=A0ABQ7SSQ6_PHRPL|nr:hypothetical protein JD844_020687 [Phrynosoma platyrhinos]
MADEQQNERKCVRGAFGVITTTGSRKLWRRAASSHLKVPTGALLFGEREEGLSDSGGRFWEELSVHPDLSMNPPNDRQLQRALSSVTHLREELEEEGKPKSFEGLETWSSPSTGRHYDMDMELTNDVQIANENLYTGTVINLPQRFLRTSELPKGFGLFADALAREPDHSSFMDVEPSESAGFPPRSLGALLPQSLLGEPDGDIVMYEKRKIKKSKEIPILEQVGESLRQKKLRATHV